MSVTVIVSALGKAVVPSASVSVTRPERVAISPSLMVAVTSPVVNPTRELACATVTATPGVIVSFPRPVISPAAAAV